MMIVPPPLLASQQQPHHQQQNLDVVGPRMVIILSRQRHKYYHRGPPHHQQQPQQLLLRGLLFGCFFLFSSCSINNLLNVHGWSPTSTISLTTSALSSSHYWSSIPSSISSYSRERLAPSRTLKHLKATTTSLLSTTTTTTTTKNSRAMNTILYASPISSSSPSSALSTTTSTLQGFLFDKLPSTKVIEGIANLSDGQRSVIASDVARQCGISISQAKRDLTLISSLSRGDIKVDINGEIIYTFPSNLQQVLRTNSATYSMQQTIQTKVWPITFWLIRIGFGVTLITSLVAIFSTIFFLQTYTNSNDDDRRRDGGSSNSNNNSFGGGGGSWSMGSTFWGPSPWDIFWYTRPYGYYGVSSNSNSNRNSPEEMGLLPSIYSYVFGDGNPNINLQQQRLQLVANMIQQNNGAVTAEQLAPYCDDDASSNRNVPNPSMIYDDLENSSSNDNLSRYTYVDESYVLPIVAALNGEPQVTEDGDIIYVFPELQMSATSNNEPINNQQNWLLSSMSTSSSARSNKVREGMILRRAGLDPQASNRDIQRLLEYNGIRTRQVLERSELIQLLEQKSPPLTDWEQEEEMIQTDPTVLREREYKFSLASTLNKVLAGGLGLLNLGGALYLGNLLNQYSLYGVRLPSYFGLIQQIFPLLFGYAVLFNLIPLLRNLWIQKENQKIQLRNQKRIQWRDLLQKVMKTSTTSTSSRLGRKLQSAKQFSIKMRQLGTKPDDIVYDTRQSMEQLKEQKDAAKLQEFDEKLKGIE